MLGVDSPVNSPDRRLVLLVLTFLITDNLWSTYSDKGAFVEKKGVPSVPVSEESRPGGLPYVLTDIMTYFTMLVGIYFPSVTGEALFLSFSVFVSVSGFLCVSLSDCLYIFLLLSLGLSLFF